MRISDPVGKRFHMLEVVEFSHVDVFGARYFKCKCDCGNENVIRFSCLTKGQISCGCNKPGYKNLIDLTGKRFGNLLVVERYGNATGRDPTWKTICDCGKKHISRGCTLRNGTSISCGCRMSYRIPVLKRFWDFVDKKDGCWEWKGPKMKIGYGSFSIKQKPYYAHRFSYELHKGEIPINMCVCHSCDNRICVNPDHLWIGTIEDNMNDMLNKERNTRGEKVGNHKLTEKQVLEIRKIRETGKSYNFISKMFPVSSGAIRRICLRLNWKHI